MHEVIAKGILSAKNGMNIYRGCLHGCIYCDARSNCYQMNHAFEDIEVKINAVELLEKTLSGKRNKCMIGTGAMTDPYLPLETKLMLTRKCLKVIDRYGFGATVHTKSDRVLRDLDILSSINDYSKAVVQMTLTTIDPHLCSLIEPNVCNSQKRFDTLCKFRDHHIPTVVWLDPILPYINDTEENIRGILEMCVEARVKGIICFSMGVTLRDGDREYFYEYLDKHFPGMKLKYCKEFGNSYEINSPNNSSLMRMLVETCEKYGILYQPNEVFHYLSQYEQKGIGNQMSLMDFGLL